MLVLCYGITKSGSTLAFELVKGMLESAGQSQVRLADGVVEAGHRINFIVGVLTRKRLRQLMTAIGPDRVIAIKTHGDLRADDFRWIERKQRSGELYIIASYRDPRDICLSLIDAGARARLNNAKAFSNIADLQRAASGVQKQILKFRKWASLRGSLRLDYETVAFRPDEAMEQIGRMLDLKYDAVAAKKHAFQGAFTQKNKARSMRHKTDLEEKQAEQLGKEFEPFLKGAFESSGEEWFTDYRRKVLAGRPDTAKNKKQHTSRGRT